jgi:hypothetical protein
MRRFIFEKEILAVTNFLQAQAMGMVLNLSGDERESLESIHTRGNLLNEVTDMLRERALELSYDYGSKENERGFAEFRKVARMAQHLEKICRTVELYFRAHISLPLEREKGPMTFAETESFGECLESWFNLVHDRDKEAAREALLAAQRLEDVTEGIKKRVASEAERAVLPVNLLEEIVSDTRAMALEVLKSFSAGEVIFESEYPPFEKGEEAVEPEDELPFEEDEGELEDERGEGPESDDAVETEIRVHDVAEMVEERRLERKETPESQETQVTWDHTGATYHSVLSPVDEVILDAERRKAQTWNAILPGIVPEPGIPGERGDEDVADRTFVLRNLGYLVRGESASLVTTASSRLMSTLEEIWRKTARDERVRTDYATRIQGSLEELLGRNPELERVSAEELSSGEIQFGSLSDMAKGLERIESTLSPLKAVYTHGELSLDRIFFDPDRDCVLFVYVGQSRFGDYLQDIQSLVASSDTMVGVSGLSRALAREVNVSMLSLAERFALEIEDTSFQKRLHLSGASSLLSSLLDLQDGAELQSLFLQAIRSLKRLMEVIHEEDQHGEESESEPEPTGGIDE